MAETNAIAEGAASTSSEQTQNAQPPETATESQAPAETAEGAEVEAAEEGEQTPEEAGKAPPKRTASARMKELKRERDEAEIRAYAAEQKLRGLRRPVQARDDMTDAQRQAVELRNAERSLESEEVASTVEEARAEMRNARFELFSEKVGDPAIVEKFCRLPRVSEELADLVAESDYAAELAAKLSNSPQEARRLSAMTPHRLGAELARMEQALSRAPAARRVSQAPEPGSSLKGGSSPPRKSLGDLPYSQYAAQRQKEIDAERR